MTDSICEVCCSSLRDFVGVTKDERCFFDDLSIRFEKLGVAFVLLDLNIFAVDVSMCFDGKSKDLDNSRWTATIMNGQAKPSTTQKQAGRQYLYTYHHKADTIRDE